MSSFLTLTPMLRGAYIVLALTMALACLWVMQQLHEQTGRSGTRAVPFNIMRGLMLGLVTAASTVFIYLALPGGDSGLPLLLVAAFRLRDLGGIAALLCLVVGIWQAFRQRGPELRGRPPQAGLPSGNRQGERHEIRQRPPTWHRESPR